MAVPPLREMIEPLLLALANAPEGLTARQAQDAVAERLQLSTEDRAVKVPGGTQVLFRHRTNWAHDRLKRARLSGTPRKGLWKLTGEGVKLAQSTGSSRDSIRDIAKAARDHLLPANDSSGTAVQLANESLRA